MDLVTYMVASQWSLRRMRALEIALLDLEMDKQIDEISKTFAKTGEPTARTFDKLVNHSKTLALYLRYETTFHSAFNKSLNTLLRLREVAAKSTVAEEYETTRHRPKTGTRRPETPIRTIERTESERIERT